MSHICDKGTTISVYYPRELSQQDITKAEFKMIQSTYMNKIVAIKFIADQYNLSLLQARNIVDTVLASPSKPIQDPNHMAD